MGTIASSLFTPRHEAQLVVKSPEPFGRTPLFYATCGLVIKALLDAGANVNHVDHDGKTALFFAVNRVAVFMLVQRGANVNHVDSNGRTPLMYAVQRATRHGMSYNDVYQLMRAIDAIILCGGHYGDYVSQEERGMYDAIIHELGVSMDLEHTVAQARASLKAVNKKKNTINSVKTGRVVKVTKKSIKK